ncbi:MAG: helix-turn-helix transcriptional regulator [Thermoproteota archaeon]
MAPLFGRSRREEELERRILELSEKYTALENRLEEILEKTERVEKGARLLTEAIYKIIAYLKDMEWPREAEPPIKKPMEAALNKLKPTVNEYLTETERKIMEEVERKGTVTVNECYGTVGKTKEHVSRVLKQMVEKGILIRERRGKTFYYRLVDKN